MKALAISLILCLCLIYMASASTLSVYAPSTYADARIQRGGVNETFYTIRGGAGTGITNASATITVTYLYSDFTGFYEALGRYGWVGDTSSIPDTATITSATFSLYGAGTKTNSVGNINASLVGFIPATPTNLVIADFNTRQTTKYATDIPYASWSNTGWNNFTLNADGRAAINKTGYTKLMITNTWDADNSTVGFTGAGYTYSRLQANDTTAGVNIPVLTIEYTVSSSYYGTNFTDFYDGIVYRESTGSFSSLRTGVGTGVTEVDLYTDIFTTNLTPNYGGNWRPIVSWNTSTIGSAATINSATITIYSSGYENTFATVPDLIWVDANPNNQSKYIAADYNKTTLTKVTNAVIASDFAFTTPIIFTVRSDQLTKINKTGITSLMLEKSWMTDNTPPTWSSLKTLEIGILNRNTTHPPILSVNYTSTGLALPTVDFISNITIGINPSTIMFTDMSSNVPNYWNWSWTNGNGTWYDFTSNLTQVTNQTFDELGQYSINLNACNEYGCGNLTKSNYITIGIGTVGFTTNQTKGKPPLIVQFTDMSGNYPSAWFWSYSKDGGTDTAFTNSTEQNPVQNFTDIGTYQIKFKATGTPTAWYNETYIYVGHAPISHFYTNVTGA